MGVEHALLGAGVSFAVAGAATLGISRPALARFLLDHPGSRSLHTAPTPRGGGLGILAGAALGSVVLAASLQLQGVVIWMGVAALALAAISLLDDLSDVHPAVRMAVHVAVAVGLFAAGLAIEAIELPGLRLALASPFSAAITCLFIVWLVNLYNFMDGMDGFAGGMAVFGFGTFAVLGGLAGHTSFLGLSMVVAAAAGGFLLFNFPPARIFMGDVGSSVLGVLAAAFSLWAAADGIFPIWIGLLVFSPFVVDATLTLLRRLVRRERVWEAHKTHCYQRVVEVGWGHRRTLLWEYALMGCAALSAVVAVHLPPGPQWALLGVWAAIYLGLVAAVSRLEARGSAAGPA